MNRSHILSGWKNTPNYSKHIEWKCTPGIGDLMYGLNVAYFRSFITKEPVMISLNWYHDKDFLYHFEDPETIIERFDYIHKFYDKNNVEVNIKHIFNSTNYKLYSQRYIGYKPSRKINDNQWIFRNIENHTQTNKNKIVVWRSTFNAQMPRTFKRTFTSQEWLDIYDIIEMQGYDIVEIDYRTPISEVMYHIRTCKATVSYEGMWHYIAKNYQKPMIVLSRNNITKLHTPHALIYKPDNEYKKSFFYDMNRRLRRASDFNEVGIEQWKSIERSLK